LADPAVRYPASVRGLLGRARETWIQYGVLLPLLLVVGTGAGCCVQSFAADPLYEAAVFDACPTSPFTDESLHGDRKQRAAGRADHADLIVLGVALAVC